MSSYHWSIFSFYHGFGFVLAIPLDCLFSYNLLYISTEGTDFPLIFSELETQLFCHFEIYRKFSLGFQAYAIASKLFLPY